MPVLVFGDTNTRYTRAEDNIALLGTQNDLKDAWVQIRRGGVQPTPGSAVDACPNPAAEDATCETVDKVLYRGSSTVTLTATSFAYVGDRFLQADGNVTSDHNPLLVNFSWSN